MQGYLLSGSTVAVKGLRANGGSLTLLVFRLTTFQWQHMTFVDMLTKYVYRKAAPLTNAKRDEMRVYCTGNEMCLHANESYTC